MLNKQWVDVHQEEKWLADSEATVHVTNPKNTYSTVQKIGAPL